VLIGSLATAAGGGKREQCAVWNNEQKEAHLCATHCDYISDGRTRFAATLHCRKGNNFTLGHNLC